MDKEYSLKRSAKTIGYLLPVLLDKNNKIIIDGVHRLNEDKDWPRLKLENIDTYKKRLIARLALNFQRRKMPIKELRRLLNDLAEEYRKGNYEGSLSEIISKETGINLRTVQRYLNKKYKQMAHAVRDSNLMTLGIKPKAMQARTAFKELVADFKCPVCGEHVYIYCDGDGKHLIKRNRR